MRLQKSFPFLLLVGMLLMACSPAASAVNTPATATAAPNPNPTPTTDPTQSGSPAGQPTSSAPVDSAPAPAQAARNALAQQSGISIDTIQILNVEPVEWPDGCLGVQKPGIMCTQVITPGYRVLLSANGKQYEYHTDETGGTVILATAPLTQSTGPVVTWELTDNGTCSRAEISAQKVAFGTCGGTLAEAQLSDNRVQELAYFLGTYSTFSRETPAGTVQFNGQGQQQPSEAEMRSIAEWAKLVDMEAQGGRGGAAWGLAIAWHREGGIAGFCNDLGVYLNGWAQPSSCKGGQLKNYPEYRLTSAELEQMYSWVDQLASIDYEHKDAASADAMTIRLALMGSGTKQADDALKEQIAGFAAQIYTNAAKP